MQRGENFAGLGLFGRIWKRKIQSNEFIIYKKRTEYEVRQKFYKVIREELLDEIIEYIKEAGYLNDKDYIERAVNELMALKNISIFEIKNKLYSKGISKDDIDDYIFQHEEELKEYEERAKQKIIEKKSLNMDNQEIKKYLIKKGFKI